MYRINPLFLEEAIKLHPSNIETYLNDPATRSILMKAKSKIHRNPYLRDKFYDIVSLTHQTNRSNVPSIMKHGILRSKSGSAGTDTSLMIKRGFLDPAKSKVVYTMKRGKKAPLDISATKDPVTLKLRIPRDQVKSFRVSDPMMPDYVGGNWQNYSIGKMFKQRNHSIPKLDRFGRPLTFERFTSEFYGLTPKQFRTKWSSLPSSEKLNLQKQYGGNFGHMSIHNKNSFNQSVRDTVALNTDIKPEWIIGSSAAKKYRFEDELRRDPNRTIAMINDLMKRS